jgi:hypothetical protein
MIGVNELTTFFGWCTVINLGFYLFSAYCLRLHLETRFDAYFLIIFEAVFSKREILQPRYTIIQMEL